MKKIIIALSFLLATFVFAETPNKNPGDKLGPQPDDGPMKYEFYWNQIPVVCGQNTEVERWANDKGFEPVNISYGHNNGNPKEPIVYIVIYWMNSNGESFASVSTPETSEVCIVFRTFNLQINPNLIKSLGTKT